MSLIQIKKGDRFVDFPSSSDPEPDPEPPKKTFGGAVKKMVKKDKRAAKKRKRESPSKMRNFDSPMTRFLRM